MIVMATSFPAQDADPTFDPSRFVRRVEFLDAADLVGYVPVHVTHRVLLDGHDVTKLLYLPWTAPGRSEAQRAGVESYDSTEHHYTWWPYYDERPFGIELGKNAEVIITLDLLPDITDHPWREGPGGVEVTERSVLITCPDGTVLEPLLVEPDPGKSHAEPVRLTTTDKNKPPAGLATWIEQGRNRIRVRMFAAEVVFRSGDAT